MTTHCFPAGPLPEQGELDGDDALAGVPAKLVQFPQIRQALLIQPPGKLRLRLACTRESASCFCRTIASSIANVGPTRQGSQ
jgi:hypothetical protein